MLTGRPAAVVMAVPPLVAIVVRLHRRLPSVTARLRASSFRFPEGTSTSIAVLIDSDQPTTFADVHCELDPRLVLVDGSPSATVCAGPDHQSALAFTVQAPRWGVYEVGPVTATTRTSGGLFITRTVVVPATKLTAVPDETVFTSRATMPLPRPLVGSHLSRAAADGVEFADVRPYIAGDSLRRVHSRTSARRGSLYVTDAHPERTSEIVVLIDASAEVGPVGATTHDIGVRAGATIARHFVDRMDRVGVLRIGVASHWLPPRAGRMHLHRIVDELVAVGAVPSVDDVATPIPRIPVRGMVIALTPLIDDDVISALAAWSRQGHGVVVIDTLPPGLVPDVHGPMAAEAVLLWSAQRASLLRRLGVAGVPTVQWAEGRGVDAMLSIVQRRLVRMPKVRA